MPYRIRGITGALYTDEEMSVPRLTSDGTYVRAGYSGPPARCGSPTQRDPLLWLPPSPLSPPTLTRREHRRGDVGAGEQMAWVTSQLALRDK
jgi:hypothetical protein